MSNFVFNIAKGKVSYYASLPLSNDGLIAVALQSSGIEADDALIKHETLQDILVVSTEQSTVGRKTLTGVTSSTLHTTNSSRADVDDFIYSGASGPAISSIVICYVPDLGLMSDGSIIPLTKHDFSAIPNGGDIPVQISATGFFVALS